MEVCMRTDFCGNDVERVVEYATRLGVANVFMTVPFRVSTGSISGMETFKHMRVFKANGDLMESASLPIRS